MKNAMTALAIMVILVIGAPNRAGAQSPQESARTAVARFVDPTAIAVIRIDVGRVDTDALYNDVAHTISEVLRETDPGSLGIADDGIRQAKEASKAWRERFKAAGGRELYFVLVFNPAAGTPIFGVAPIGEGAEEAELIGVLAELPADLGKGGRVVEGVIVTGDEKLTEGKPLPDAARLEEIEKAFTRAGDAPVQIALIPSEPVRHLMAEQLGALPEQFGGGPATVLSKGVVRGWGAVSLPPSWSFKLVAESESEEAAKDLESVLRKGVASLAERAELSQPGLGEVLTATIEPRAEGNLVVISAGREKFERVKRALVPSLMRQRTAVQRAVSASHMRQQMVGCMTYAAAMENKWPKDLQTLVTEGYLTPDMLEDPARPDLKPAYVYIRPDDEAIQRTDPSKHAVLYENFTEWPKNGVWIAYADGHVQAVTEEAAFKEALEYARRHAAK